ncbi:MAG: LacI family DNA-binding transcriptional regulator [Actinomycetales bacterium]
MRPRLAEIASAANVSEATVSRVLNGRPGVAEATRDAVLTAVDVLGYERPSQLRSTTTGQVGLVIAELENPVFAAFAQHIESELIQHGYTTVLCSQRADGLHEDEYVAMLLDRGVSGLVFVSGLHADSTADPQRYLALRRRGLPIVLVNGYLPGVDAPFISNDDVTSMDLAIAHLASQGHRRIGLAVGSQRFTPVLRKVDGFTSSMAQRLDERAPLITYSMFSVEGGAVAAGVLLDAGATAIICGSDLMALGVIRAARDRGLSVPQDLSVVGYDDSLLIGYTDPPLTTVRQSVPTMSSAAVAALLSEISGVRAERAEYIFRPELVVRASTAAAPA